MSRSIPSGSNRGQPDAWRSNTSMCRECIWIYWFIGHWHLLCIGQTLLLLSLHKSFCCCILHFIVLDQCVHAASAPNPQFLHIVGWLNEADTCVTHICTTYRQSCPMWLNIFNSLPSDGSVVPPKTISTSDLLSTARSTACSHSVARHARRPPPGVSQEDWPLLGRWVLRVIDVAAFPIAHRGDSVPLSTSTAYLGRARVGITIFF